MTTGDKRIVLIGRAVDTEHTVLLCEYGCETEIGSVRMNAEKLWSAYDLEGRNHGDWYNDAWSAAKQLQLGLGAGVKGK